MVAEQPTGQVSDLLLSNFDYVWQRVRGRVDGLTQAEYLWEPVDGCWSVRERGDSWRVDATSPEPSPPPVTTIAWRLWHIGSECLAGYTSRGLAEWPLDVEDDEWYPDPDQALNALDVAWQAFRAGIAALGESGMWRPLGEGWGAFADDPWAGLVVHALDEVAHHGAEVALLRDLYAHRS